MQSCSNATSSVRAFDDGRSILTHARLVFVVVAVAVVVAVVAVEAGWARANAQHARSLAGASLARSLAW